MTTAGTGLARMKTSILTQMFWDADLTCQRANEKVWASGVDLPDSDPRVQWATRLDAHCGRLVEELERRAEHWVTFDLDQLVDDLGDTFHGPTSPAVAEKIRAAAALRVFRSDAYLDDAEALQPGVELPAVGVYAELED